VAGRRGEESSVKFRETGTIISCHWARNATPARALRYDKTAVFEGERFERYARPGVSDGGGVDGTR
jgi:hypothetical protein